MIKRFLTFVLCFLALRFEVQANHHPLHYYNGYDFEVSLIDGKALSLYQFHGKPMIIVNLPAKCSFNVQYFELEELWQKYNNRGLVIIAMTSDDFSENVNRKNSVMADYCKISENFSFYISAPVNIIEHQETVHPLYQWIKLNKGDNAIEDDYFKVLIGSDGEIVNIFPGNIPPLDDVFVKEVERILPNE